MKSRFVKPAEDELAEAIEHYDEIAAGLGDRFLSEIRQAVGPIESFSDESSYEDIQYHIYVRQRIERGLEAAGRGDLIDQEEVERLLHMDPSFLGAWPRR